MKRPGPLMRLLLQEDLNFLLTNRLPRRLATKLVGRIAAIEHPLVARPALALFRAFARPDLTEAAPIRYRSLREAFIRPLKPGLRSPDPHPAALASPCDAIVGAIGRVEDGRLYQVKGFPYRLADLLPRADLAERYRDGWFATLRLTAGMYHRFHAPHDLTVERVTYLSGDCWNVNPIALKRVERLFCRNERAAIETRLPDGTSLLLVPVAAILVASIRLACLDVERTVRELGSKPVELEADAAKGEEMGWFEHGSTILLFLPADAIGGWEVSEGETLKAGQRIARLLTHRHPRAGGDS